MKFLVAVAAFFLATFSVASGQSTPLNVTMHVWIGDNLTTRYNMLVSVFNWTRVVDLLYTARNSGLPEFTFALDRNFRWIQTIGGNSVDPANNIDWLFFELDEAPMIDDPPGVDKFAQRTLFRLPFKDGKHYLFWLRHDNLRPVLRIWEHVWIGDDMATRYNTRIDLQDVAFTLFNVMVRAKSVGRQYYFRVDFEGNDNVTKIGGHSMDSANNTKWFVFELAAAPTIDDPPGASKLTSHALFDTIPTLKHFLFWLRTDSLTAITTTRATPTSTIPTTTATPTTIETTTIINN